MNPTQIEIARLTGLSHATVSRALADSPLISKATKEKVRLVASELGYRKNAVISNLMAMMRAGRDPEVRSTIAYLSSFPLDQFSSFDANWEQFYLGAKKRAESLGYHLDVIWRNKPGLTRAGCAAILSARGIRGFIVSPRDRALGRLSMDWKSFACATLGHNMPGPHLHSAMADHYQNAILALRTARKYGYRRIGLMLTREQDGYFSGMFKAAFLLHLESVSPEERVEPFLRLSDSNPSKDRAAREWIKRHKPDVILCGGSHVDELLASMGLKVPRDMALADLTLGTRRENRAGVWERTAETGACAVDLVVEQLHNNELGPPAVPKSVRVEGSWHDGPTMPKRRVSPPSAGRKAV
jgi:DNA-binding LacI/PurR family transcriptional regulator